MGNDITEHPTREGKLYCRVVLDAYSWPSTRAALPAIPAGIIHGDHGTQFTSWNFTERARKACLAPSMGSVGDPYDNAVGEACWGRPQSDGSTAAAGAPATSGCASA
ncbi:transposase family protein [Natronosporangium hydrolyticum]|uniref:Transposase family protein n=1 Tax=Natronosporangium hydrolyticum TaxID=2811111 RepID=A0A895Y8Y7_9ACTN|nr:hypothetical protein [Natronosporangium hydrolyticum]QSB14197.1 transposase family protein [Natronosporangium hydrolyticum]